jgi:hypothetical protein
MAQQLELRELKKKTKQNQKKTQNKKSKQIKKNFQ